MRQVLSILSAVGCIALALPALAKPHCRPTTEAAVSYYPGAAVIPTSNNLLLPEGKSVAIEGQRLVISGRVLDRSCMPVREAVVELWQTDPFGRYFLAEGADLVDPTPVFAGAGRTVTDAYGQFTFITAFPGAAHSSRKEAGLRAPQLNLRIKAAGFDIFRTALFFENDRRNETDELYEKLSAPARAGVTLSMSQTPSGDLNGKIDLILDGDAPYQTY